MGKNMFEVGVINNPHKNISKKPNNTQISFKGYEIKGNKVKFFTPGKKGDEGKSTLNYFATNTEEQKPQSLPLKYDNGMLTAEVTLPANDTRFAYDFNIKGNKILDMTQKGQFNGETYAITRDARTVAFEKPHQIYHVVPDNFNPKDMSRILDKDGNFIWRNHFDLYGGNISGVIEKLDYIKELGAGRIMGTPIFGADDVSCHGYWTQNPYQIASNMGTMDDFDKLNVELFKKGMGWIADGAFVNQGLMGVQFQDMLRAAANGGYSPYSDWFTLYNKKEPNQDFILGVLPQDDDGNIAFDKFDIKFINSPFTETGEKKPVDKDAIEDDDTKYNPRKPTYIQLFDPRDKSKATIHKSFDSVQRYRFPINPADLEEKFDYTPQQEMVDGKLPKEQLLTWSTFTLDTSDYDSDKQLWDGNRDVLKMNMQNAQVRNYIMGAAKFWTARVDNQLLKYVSENINKQLCGKEVTAKNIKEAIDVLEAAKILPQGVAEMTEADIQKAMDNNQSSVLYLSLTEAIKSYPAEAIELPREIVGIITNPEFKANLEKIYSSNKFETLVNNIINSESLTAQTRAKLSDPETLRLVGQDIAKSILVKAISGLDYLPGDNLPKGWTNDLGKATKAKINERCPQFFMDTNEAAVKHLTGIVTDGLSDVNTHKLAQRLNEQLKDVDTKTVRVAKSLLDKMESGLDWRIDAAKDVADMDGVRNGRVDKEKAFEFVTDFWAEFCQNVRNINPKAYIIGEVTDVPGDKLPDFVQSEGFSTLSNYNYMFGAPYEFVHAHPEFRARGNASGFFANLERFTDSWPINAINSAHNMVDNHDKTRVLQNLLLHPDTFNSQGPEHAMAEIIKYALCKAYDVEGKGGDINKVKAQYTEFAKVYDAVDQAVKQHGKNFGYWNIERAIDSVIKISGVDNKPLAQTMALKLFNDATDKYIRALYLMIGSPGAPELFAGTELGMTGGETISKNVYNQNRNPLPWIWLDEITGRPEIKAYNSQVKSLFNLRNKKELKVLNNGFIKDLNHKNDKNGVLAFMRYNADQQAIVILNNGNTSDGKASDIEKGDFRGNIPANNKEPYHNYELKVTESGIDVGAVFVNAETNVAEDDTYYIVWSDGILRKKPAEVNSAEDIANYKLPKPGALYLDKGKVLYRVDNTVTQDELKPAPTKKLDTIV